MLKVFLIGLTEMKIIFWFIVVFLICFFLMTFICRFSQKQYGNNKRDLLILALFFGGIIFVSFFAIPSMSDDLYRWHAVVNWYRIGQPQFYVFSSFVQPITDKALVLFNLSMYITAQTDSNSYLQIIWLSINYICIFVVVSRLLKIYKMSWADIFSWIILYFGLTPYVYSLSGLRNNAIASIFFMGVYFAIFEDKKYLVWILSIIGVFIHPAMGLFLGIWLVCNCLKYGLYRLIILWTLIADILIWVINKVPLQITKSGAEKLYMYIHEYSVDSDIRINIVLVLFMLIVLLSIWLLSRKKIIKDSRLCTYCRFVECIILFNLGSISNYVFFQRGVMLLGCCLLPYIYIIYRKFAPQLILNVLLLFFSIGLNSYYLVTLFNFFVFKI